MVQALQQVRMSHPILLKINAICVIDIPGADGRFSQPGVDVKKSLGYILHNLRFEQPYKQSAF